MIYLWFNLEDTQFLNNQTNDKDSIKTNYHEDTTDDDDDDDENDNDDKSEL